MMTRTKVLIALDGSAWSRQILTPIRQLLTPANHELMLLRVAELPVGIVGAPPRPIATGWMRTMYESQRDLEYTLHPIYDSQQEANKRAALEMTLLPDQQLLQRDGFIVTSLVRFGDPAEEIANLARHANVDIVAMATHGQTGLRHLIMGSMAEQVLRDLTIPVLLICPADRTEDHASARPMDRGLNGETRLAEGSPADEILRISAAEHADLIIMTTHGRSGMERLLLGSVAAKVLQNADVPVLLTHACAQVQPAPVDERHEARQR